MGIMVLAETGAFPTFSWNLWQTVQQMFQFEFMRYALISGTVLSIVCGLVGYFMVLRHQTFAGESLADVAFAGALGAALFGMDVLVGLVIATVCAAIGIGMFGERMAERDIATGTMLAWVLGLGVLFLNLFTKRVSGTGTGLSGISVLFGSILSISSTQTLVIATIGAVIIASLFVIGRPLLFASLDPGIAAARGVPVRLLGLVFLTLLAVTVAEAVQGIGALLVFALLLLPPAIAHRLTVRPYTGLFLSPVLAAALTWIGISIGFYAGLPSSVCISLVAFCSYVIVAWVPAGWSFMRGMRSQTS